MNDNTKHKSRETKRVEYFKEQIKRSGHDKTLLTDDGWDEARIQELADKFVPPVPAYKRSDANHLVDLLKFMPTTFELHRFLYVVWLRDEVSASLAETFLSKEARKENGIIKRVGRGLYEKTKK